jgi:site-specific DNA-methyltransferase (adenine-specific)
MELLHGDCLEVMKTLPDKSVDLFVCDLPYGCLTGGAGKEKAKRIANVPNRHRGGYAPTDRGERVLPDGTTKHAGVLGGCAWDIKIDLVQFWVQVKRLAKNDHTPVLMFCTTRFGADLINSNPSWFRYDLVWNKMRGVSFLLANKMPMRSHENIYVFSKKGANYYRKDIADETKKARKKNREKKLSGNVYGSNLVEGNDTPAGIRCALSVIDADNNANKKGKHPTQKPDDLYEWLIERYSKPGDTVLDPTAGSFASVFTAHRLGRTAIGIEKDEAFYEKARQKISA